MSTKASEPAARVLTDERGAILVMGIFMCTCLVGAMWYLAGVGDAILYRERLQEAADAAVFSDAVLHARGMNLIVLINLIMACVLGVRVALKVAQLVLLVAAVVFAVIGIFVEVFLAAADPCAQGAADLQDTIDEMREPINKTLEALTKAQTGIARLTPGLAEAGMRDSVGPKYAPDAVQALVVDTAVLSGLPVAAGSADKLCAEAGYAVGALFGWVLKKAKVDVFDDASTWLGDKMASIVSVSPSFFCEMGSGGNSPDDALNSLMGDSTKDECKNGGPVATYEMAELAWEDKCKEYGVVCTGDDGRDVPVNQRAIRPQGTQRGTTTPDHQKELNSLLDRRNAAAKVAMSYRTKFGDSAVVDQGTCEKWAKDDAKRQMKEKQDSSKGGSSKGGSSKDGSSNDSSMTGKKVKDGWVNGGEGGQLVGGVSVNTSRLERSAQLVRVAAVGDRRAASLDAPMVAKMPAWAQAEFFLDCSGTWATCNKNDDAMWQLKWRARLRRYNASKPIDQLAELFAGSAAFDEGMKGLAALASGAALHQPIDTLPGSLALQAELTSALTDRTIVTRGIH